MANVIINNDKMPKLVAKVEGKGSGIKTVIVNMSEIAKSLNMPPTYLTKYLGFVLGAQVSFDNKADRYILNGNHQPNKLQDLLDGFIQKCVLCISCENQEIILSVNKQRELIETNCMSCGHHVIISAVDDHLAAYILKNPPPESAATAVSATDTNVAKTVGTNRSNDNDDEYADQDDEDQDWGRRKKAKIESSQQIATGVHLDSDTDDFDDIDYGDDEEDNENYINNQIDEYLMEEKSLLNTDGGDEEEDDDDDEEVDEEQSADLDDNEEESDRVQDDTQQKAAEKCRYWPNCNAGDSCSYHHPTKHCRTFPKCRFGQDCLYIHPICKYFPNCTRPGCPFAHPAKPPGRPNFSITTEHSSMPRCKYGHSCKNMTCKFQHNRSEPCRFGTNCLSKNCPYTHPSDPVKPNAFKWIADTS